MDSELKNFAEKVRTLFELEIDMGQYADHNIVEKDEYWAELTEKHNTLKLSIEKSLKEILG